MKSHLRKAERTAFLVCAVITWLSAPTLAADGSTTGGRIDTGDVVVRMDAAKEVAK